MPDKAFSDYFYGDEATQFTYFRIPCQLITPGLSTCPRIPSCSMVCCLTA